MKVFTGDVIQVITGKYKGKQGKVLKASNTKNMVLIEGVNIVKKHVKKDKADSGIVEFEKPINVSNVKVVCPACKKPTRIGYSLEDGSKKRECKSCRKVLTK